MSDLPLTTSGARPPIVLVHGAWLGAFCWDRVIAAIDDPSREIVAVQLRGSGSRRDENGPHITRDDHVDDVVDAIVGRHLTNVVLVGHSYGGRVITGVIERIGERIGRVIYVDAHAPVLDDPGPSDERRAIADAHGQMLPLMGVRLDAALVGGADELARITEMIVDHPFATLTSPWRAELPVGLERTYVHALGPDGEPFRCYARVCANDPTWEYIEIDGPHMLMYSHPRELAAIIAR